ncbi:hypothetical protein DPMN_193025 [Dreissena polymorpha]|uniref:Ubiquitin-like domain-containing protein n=1 Tax=Dreissena polymorpha TaxID=45954 RepID=A0A9D3Y487_DREPO|nr:hypothetical protein DPMN_193025 [Dreissena polymorpha]
MHLPRTTLGDKLISIEVSQELEVQNLKAQCEFELGIALSTIVLTWEGRPLHDNQKMLKEYGIKDGDMLLLQHVQPS